MQAVIDRARSVLQHIDQIGGQPSDFSVCITAAEGFELITWLREQYAEILDMREFDHDVSLAQAAGDPWVVLKHFDILGLKIERRLH